MIYPIRKARVYRIISKKHPEFAYVGSTFGTLKQRFYNHKKHYIYWKEGKRGNVSLYSYFDKWGVQDFKMVEMGVYMVCAENAKDRTHLNAWEQLWINRTRGCCNKYDCFTIEYLQKLKKKERGANYYTEHKEQHKEYMAKYYTENKQMIKEINRVNVTCQCGAIVTKVNLKRHQKTSKKHIRLMEMQRTG